MVRTDFVLTHLGVVFSGGPAQVRVRTEKGWGAWSVLSSCDGGRDGVAAPDTALLTTPGADGYDVVVTGEAHVVELNTSGEPGVSQLAPVQNGIPLPDGTHTPVPYLSRAAWGANESLRFKGGVEFWPAEFVPVQTLTVHHTAGNNNDPDPAWTVRAIYHLQCIDKDWGDIGYHLLIDEAGRAYEGRVSGADGWPVYGPLPGADGRPQMAIGAHVKTYNAGNIGVCLLGNFMDATPKAAAVRTLELILTDHARLGGLNPVGTTAFIDAVSGLHHTGSTISGHRNWAATECPGDRLYGDLAAVRGYVSAALLAMNPPKPIQRLPTQPSSTPDPPGSRTPTNVPTPPDQRDRRH